MSGIVAILGAGVIGAGWAARFALMGWPVRVFDPAPAAAETLHAALDRARASLPALYDGPLPAEGAVTLCETLAEAVGGADWIQESLPERLDLKHALYRDVQAVADPAAILASSTSGFTPSDLQTGALDPAQIIVAHPFNPVYLLPAVEIVGSDATAPDMLARAETILAEIGMAPTRVAGEIPAHVADRLLEAVWREALWLVKDEVATTGQIDEIIRMGFGLRWAQMGLFETYRIAGGPGGMAHFLGQFGPALKWPWTKLMEVPDLDKALISRIAEQSDAQSGHRSIAELEAARDGNLVALLRALKDRGEGAGAHLAAHGTRFALAAPSPDAPAAPVTLDRQVPVSWVDYNGHMNEAHYLTAFSNACDQLLNWAGMDPESGLSIFTVETHIRHLDEVQIGERIQVTTRVIEGGGKRLHIWQELFVDERLCATGEQMLLHVDLTTRKTALPAPDVADWLARAQMAQAGGPLPEGLGATIGER
ncbi:carnitine 3-dehydrogenase [Gymnodinialimonas sp. 2305UL16-5]|uniref:carnitine 3-dehydrogenase n=1 Tax=Gymnodinialimonas mytili TaxID=3126503 RepID=UPI00309CCC00